MPINFLQLLQDSWNFMRNQRQFSAFAIGMTLIIQFAMSNITFPISDITNIDLSGVALPSILIGLANTFLTALIILNISAINNGSFKHFFSHTSTVLSAFLGLIALSIIGVLPLSIGAVLVISQPDNPVFAIPFMVLGFYFIVKFYLIFYVYLIEKPRKSIKDTVVFTFQLTKQKTLPLILLILLASFVPSTLMSVIEKITMDISFIIPLVVGSFFNVFATVLTFRFYQLYRKL